ncbi:MAG: SusD/RagB family nutrient-binding outer membrane lipoprotein [Muribaculaceae bacterium]|nr:SusD/RagB family nutrient-binding outer membrane lipoprotein [Muribaculaceae bacterium]
MKISKYFIALACFAASLGLASCNDWLDVNTDPDSPNNKSALVENRLPWIERWFMYEHGIVNMRTSCNIGVFYSTTGNLGCGDWEFGGGSTTTPYQSWFVGCAANLPDIIEKAQKDGATHYEGVAELIYAYGFMDMLDLYGEMPYTEALGASAVPSYDNGKVIYEGCLARIDRAIELLQTPQSATAVPLSSGDIAGGDVNKWLKLAYGLKARYLLRISKKAEFNPDMILDCLAKGPQNNNDNLAFTCYNSGSDVTDYLMGDPVMTNGNWNYLAYGSNQRMSKYHYDLLTNMRGAGVEDPRADKDIPWVMTNMRLDANGNVADAIWMRSQPVDIINDANGRLHAGGAFSISAPTWTNVSKDLTYEIKNEDARAKFVAEAKLNHAVSVDGEKVTVTYAPGSLYVNSTNYILAGDTVYVNLRANSTLTGNAHNPMDTYWHFQLTTARDAGASSTGIFQVQPMSPFDLMTYSECCFIKAEVLFRKGDKAGALAAYKAGIQASIDDIQAQANDYVGAGYTNFILTPMDNAKITAYMNSAAVCQNASDLTMSDIMLQKYVALGCCSEIYVDMRRFNYSAGNVGNFGVVYPGMDHPAMFTGQSVLPGSNKNDVQYWPRRWRLPATLELTYNETQALLVNKNANQNYIWSLPVWWDCATDEEYFSYIQ